VSGVLKGVLRIDKKTKNLIPRLKLGDIALISHEDIDEVSAVGLINAKVSAVINTANSATGRYPNRGPYLMVSKGVLLMDTFDEKLFNILEESEVIELHQDKICKDGLVLASGRIRTAQELKKVLEDSRISLEKEIDRFVENTLEHAYKEKGLFGQVKVPGLGLELKNRVVLVVVRGFNYQQDLEVLKPYIRDTKPILFGVDGGADALLEEGFKPHLIVGDMDSVSDRALQCGAVLLVHAYPDGKCPGLARLQRLGLKPVIIKSPGTSEDVALWVAYEKQARLIVAVGTHSNIVDFLEKGRKGMASTFLVRLKVGSILIDAKGVSELYQGNPKKSYVWQIVLAGLLPLILIASLSEVFKQWLALLILSFRAMTGF
jgi:uncharacterized membrane-anchored protein